MLLETINERDLAHCSLPINFKVVMLASLCFGAQNSWGWVENVHAWYKGRVSIHGWDVVGLDYGEVT